MGQAATWTSTTQKLVNQPIITKIVCYDKLVKFNLMNYQK